MPSAKSKQKLRVVEEVAGTSGGATPGQAIPITRAVDEVATKYQILFEQASDAIITVLPDGRIDDLNRAFEEVTGYIEAELDGQNVSILVPNPEVHHIPSRARALTAEVFATPGTYEDVALLRKDGYVRLVELSVRHVSNSGQPLFFALIRDVTEKKSLERELITKHAELKNAYYQLEKSNLELKSMQDTLVQAGKMAALGELAAGIAHELNQPLQGVRGYAQELTDLIVPLIQGKPETPMVEVSLKEIIAAVDKMAKIIQYLRSFTRKSVEGLEMTHVHTAIEETLKLMNRQFASRGIEVVKDFDANVPEIYANPVQLEQIFINLATNARDAIESTKRGRGKLEIKTRRVGKFVEVAFRDDGVGMSEMTKSKAFNPFFSTKEVGKGMGLGLSLSYGILNKIQGTIVVESELGKGAEFRVRLPVDFRETV
ncbi:MAG: sensor histidine kinase [Bacteriovoracia bacterium]